MVDRWNISNFISCVATVVEERRENEHREIERGRDRWRGSPLQDVWSYCSCPPTILGRWSTNVMTNTEHVDSMFWQMYPELSRPLCTVFCVGSRYHTTSKIFCTTELKISNSSAERRVRCNEDIQHLHVIS